MDYCQDCRHNINGYCHALPPRPQEAQLDTERLHDDEYFKYPQVIPTAVACTHYKKGP